MFFIPIIQRWGVATLAGDLGLPTKNVRRWIDLDSIPAEWFARVARAAHARGFADVRIETLAYLAEQRGRTRGRDDVASEATAA